VGALTVTLHQTAAVARYNEAVDLRNMVEGERQLAWGNLIEREMMGAH
jgi:hypothetical protein